MLFYILRLRIRFSGEGIVVRYFRVVCMEGVVIFKIKDVYRFSKCRSGLGRFGVNCFYFGIC